jgi:hypothetical protein
MVQSESVYQELSSEWSWQYANEHVSTAWCGLLKTAYFFPLPHFQYGRQTAILENIQWVISHEP